MTIETLKVHIDCAQSWRSIIVYCFDVIFDIAGVKWAIVEKSDDAVLTYGPSNASQAHTFQIRAHALVSAEINPVQIGAAKTAAVFKDWIERGQYDRNFSGSDPIFVTWLLLSGEIERCFPFDPYGVPKFAQGDRKLLSGLASPLVNAFAAIIPDLVAERRGRQFARVPRWPEGKRCAVAITHDVDEPYSHRRALFFWKRLQRCLAERQYPLAARSALATIIAGTAEWASLRPLPENDPNFGFESWMTFEKSIGARSTFYVATTTSAELGSCNEDVAYDVSDPPIKEALKKCAEAGWEISLHASINVRSSASRMILERDKLSEVLGGRVVPGVRHHYWAIDCHQPQDTWKSHVVAQLGYDSSLGMNDRPGFRRGIAWPFLPFDALSELPIDLVQIPPTLMDGAVDQSTSSYSEKLALISSHLQEIAEVGGLGVLDWHLEQANPTRLRETGPALKEALLEFSQRSDVCWMTAEEAASWWRVRRESLRRPDSE
ncbi:polysaccharide deacetylase family protein [soil metagenome]